MFAGSSWQPNKLEFGKFPEVPWLPLWGSCRACEAERALSAPYGGTSPKGRGKGGCAAKLPNSNLPSKVNLLNS